jgi:precorrin-4 methylase
VLFFLCPCPCVPQIESLAAAKAQLKTQVRNLLSSQTDLLSRVATVTTKWQQAVAENAALHRQNLQLAASQGM